MKGRIVTVAVGEFPNTSLLRLIVGDENELRAYRTKNSLKRLHSLYIKLERMFRHDCDKHKAKIVGEVVEFCLKNSIELI